MEIVTDSTHTKLGLFLQFSYQYFHLLILSM